ncbi:MAG: NADH-quinone oxidoreductase subunit G [Aeromicrobium sp.]|uniref:NADH-quinone oxidoreductase subunit G n=1 Tax=Aeromicrobium sp. TaxID=1871063 RepID=UPI0039E71745
MTVEATPQTQAPVELVTVTIDDISVSVPKGTLVIRAAELIGVDIPRFCDHPLLDPVGACRQCLVDVPDAGNGRGFPKPQASCTLEVAPGMVVRTHLTSEVAAAAQRGTMEFLLVNHPLDCPVCDKGGECPLQNQAMSHGRTEGRFAEAKRTFAKPVPVSAQVLLDRERCVLCARCTRFSEQVAGDPFIALVERGAQQQIGTGPDAPFQSYFSGNTIQICPVGALTSADYRFRSRPFDLVSVPSVAEHDACGAAIRVDHRRGRVLRRLAGDDPQVNEEWISDKDRFAFTWSRQDDRLRTPLVRDESGELRPMSWPGALAVAGRLLESVRGAVGVLPGGRLTLEDAHGWSAFARIALGTNDVDFRSRAIGPEEADFLAARVAGSGLGPTYADLDRARRVVLVALEPEDEAATLFLRLRRAVRRRGLRVVTVASHRSRGSVKLGAELVQAVPGQEAAALAALGLGPGDVVLAGERAALVPGLLALLSDLDGVPVAWVPRRAGDRAAVEAGLLPNLLPGGRPVASAEARADLAAGWGGAVIPRTRGRDTAGIVEAVADRSLLGLLVGGVEIADLPDPSRARAALTAADVVVSLEVRRSEVTDHAHVVLPVAPPAEKSGTFVTWEGRRRGFEAALGEPGSLPDVRVLAGIAEEMGCPLGFRATAEALADHEAFGAWDGARAEGPSSAMRAPERLAPGHVVVATWRQLVDDGRSQDGQPEYRATARPAVALASAGTWEALGVTPGGSVRLAGGATFPARVGDLPDGVVWVPGNNGVNLRELGLGHGSVVAAEAGPFEAPRSSSHLRGRPDSGPRASKGRTPEAGDE